MSALIKLHRLDTPFVIGKDGVTVKAISNLSGTLIDVGVDPDDPENGDIILLTGDKRSCEDAQEMIKNLLELGKPYFYEIINAQNRIDLSMAERRDLLLRNPWSVAAKSESGRSPPCGPKPTTNSDNEMGVIKHPVGDENTDSKLLPQIPLSIPASQVDAREGSVTGGTPDINASGPEDGVVGWVPSTVPWDVGPKLSVPKNNHLKQDVPNSSALVVTESNRNDIGSNDCVARTKDSRRGAALERETISECGTKSIQSISIHDSTLDTSLTTNNLISCGLNINDVPTVGTAARENLTTKSVQVPLPNFKAPPPICNFPPPGLQQKPSIPPLPIPSHGVLPTAMVSTNTTGPLPCLLPSTLPPPLPFPSLRIPPTAGMSTSQHGTSSCLQPGSLSAPKPLLQIPPAASLQIPPAASLQIPPAASLQIPPTATLSTNYCTGPPRLSSISLPLVVPPYPSVSVHSASSAHVNVRPDPKIPIMLPCFLNSDGKIEPMSLQDQMKISSQVLDKIVAGKLSVEQFAPSPVITYVSVSGDKTLGGSMMMPPLALPRPTPFDSYPIPSQSCSNSTIVTCLANHNFRSPLGPPILSVIPGFDNWNLGTNNVVSSQPRGVRPSDNSQIFNNSLTNTNCIPRGCMQQIPLQSRPIPPFGSHNISSQVCSRSPNTAMIVSSNCLTTIGPQISNVVSVFEKLKISSGNFTSSPPSIAKPSENKDLTKNSNMARGRSCGRETRPQSVPTPTCDSHATCVTNNFPAPDCPQTTFKRSSNVRTRSFNSNQFRDRTPSGNFRLNNKNVAANSYTASVQGGDGTGSQRQDGKGCWDEHQGGHGGANQRQEGNGSWDQQQYDHGGVDQRKRGNGDGDHRHEVCGERQGGHGVGDQQQWGHGDCDQRQEGHDVGDQRQKEGGAAGGGGDQFHAGHGGGDQHKWGHDGGDKRQVVLDPTRSGNGNNFPTRKVSCDSGDFYKRDNTYKPRCYNWGQRGHKQYDCGRGPW